jgi:hypothetical protein
MTVVHASLTRISDLADHPYDIVPLPRVGWATGDYVACRVLPPQGLSSIELADGRRIDVTDGDVVIGAFGSRFATLEATGDWRRVGADLRLEALTSAGLFGKVTSVSSRLPPLLSLIYTGHVQRGGAKVTMNQFAPDVQEAHLDTPVILLIGSSMSAGKTTTARVIIERLKARALNVVGTKLTGAGRYADILAMKDAGADTIVDFVDAGLPSTVVSAIEYRRALKKVIAKIEGTGAHVVVAEAGASPLEPYNGDTAIEEIGRNIVLTILCASDPYSVIGVTTAYHRKPDLVAGVAASTDAGVALIERLSGLRAMNLLDQGSHAELDELLEEAIRSYEWTRAEARANA